MNFAHYGHTHNEGIDWLIMLLLLGLVILFVIVLLKMVPPADKGGSALDDAKKRYAKGEITKKQLDEIRSELKR